MLPQHSTNKRLELKKSLARIKQNGAIKSKFSEEKGEVWVGGKKKYKVGKIEVKTWKL